jgi:hypothetical protein
MIHFKSINHPLAPTRNKFVRANTIISGYYIETVCTNPPRTFLSIISQTDIGVNILFNLGINTQMAGQFRFSKSS